LVEEIAVIMEFRTYTMQPGARESFVRYFEAEAIPRMRAAGMTVLGQFSAVTDEHVFAYARTFDSLEQREEQYQAFYESEDWLGWMIDTAMGKEESFIVFLGDSQANPEARTSGLSGVHTDRFTLASARGLVAEAGAEMITVDGDEGGSFAVQPEVRVFFTPNGRGPGRAQVISMAELQVGDRVLVLGARTEAGAIARQIVKRPPA
jgi:hypothetical protein